MSGSRLSIRARLSLAIMALTALVGGLAVFAGLRAFEDQIRDGAVDRRLSELAELSEADLLTDIDPFEIAVDEGDVFDDGEPIDEGELIEFDTEAAATEIGFFLTELTSLGLSDDLFAEFSDADGNLNILLFTGEVGVFDASRHLIDVTDIEEAGSPLVPESDVFELVAVSFEQFEEGPVEAERDLEFVTIDIDDLELGLVVDATDELLALEGIRTSLWVAAGVLVVLAGAATWVLAGQALRPVAAITDRVDAITSGTLDGRVPEPGSSDEVGVLAQTMNRMLGRLERADLQRRQFVSDASHELRTPVAVLRSEAEVASRAPDTTTVASFASVVLGETKRLEGLVEDLLSLARADEGRSRSGRGMVQGAVEVDVDEVVLAEAGRTRRLPVDLSQVSAGRVLGREDDLARAVGHLLDNAARHGESAMAVGVQTSDDRVRIWVEDDGAGLAEDDRDRIFQRFTRLDEARTRDRGGSGLGLAVVAETVGRLGGTVSVDRGPLGGARFLLDLPAAS